MVRFLLHHLCGPAGKGFSPVLKVGSLPPDFDGLPAPDPAGTGKTQTAFFRVAGVGFLQNLRIPHDLAGSFVVEGDDTLVHTNPIGGHTDATAFVMGQCLRKVRSDGPIIPRCQV